MSTSSPVRKIHDIPIVLPQVEPLRLPEIDPERYVPMVPVVVPERVRVMR